MRYKPIVILIFLFLLGCEETVPLRENPLDDNSGDYEPPTISLLDIVNGDTLFSEAIEFTWEGNELVSEFRYRLDSFPWSNWSENAGTTLNYLDEGEHQLSVQSRYLNGDTSEISSIIFIIDAVDGPSLMFFPRKHVAQVEDTVLFTIIAEEVANLMMSEMVLEYDPSMLEICGISQGPIFQNGQNSIFIYEIDSETGTVQINTTLLDGDNPFVSGTGGLAEIQVRVLQIGSAAVSFNNNCLFINSENNSININEKVNALVVAE